MIDVSEQSFERDVLEASHRVPILVGVWSPTQAPSRALAAMLEQIEDDMAGAFELVRIDAQENGPLLARIGVKSLPFALLFKDGEAVDGFLGTPREATVRAFVKRHVPPAPAAALPERLAEARGERRWADVAALARMLLAINPADRDVRSSYVQALAKLRRVDEAERAFEPLARRPGADPAVDALRTLLTAAKSVGAVESEAGVRDSLATALAAAEGPAGTSGETAAGSLAVLAARHRLSQWLLVAGRPVEAMDEALAVLDADRRYGDGAARATVVAALEFETDKAVVADYRRRLAATLFR